MLFLFPGRRASALDLLEATKLDMEFYKLPAKTRDPYAPQYTGRWANRAAIKWNVDALNRTLYWNNNAHTETIDSGQVKTVGWEWELGARLTNYLDVFEYHHSRHIMEDVPEDRFLNSSNQFPVETSYGIRIHLIRGK